MNLKEGLQKFVDFLKKQDKSPSTITAYSKDISQLHTYLEKKKSLKSIDDIDTKILSDYVQFLKSDNTRHYTLKTISRKINSMKTYFKTLKANKLISKDPAIDVEHPKYTIAPPRILNKLEYRALRDVARNNSRLYTIVELLLQTGIRIGEVARISVEDFQIAGKKKQLRIRKYASNSERMIELNEPAVTAIKNYLSSRPQTNDGVTALFVTKNGNRLLVRNIRTSISRAFEKAGIEDATVNDIRNTFIVEQLRAGMPIEQVSEIVGHKRLTSTKKYLELVDKKPKRKTTKITPL